MIVLTCSYRESNISKNLVPVGPAAFVIYYVKIGTLFPDNINDEASKNYPEAQYLFNARFHFWDQGHPTNNNKSCRITGDLYKVTDSEQTLVNKNHDNFKGTEIRHSSS